MLSLDRQNSYRERLRALQPGWRPATEVYEAAVRRYLRPGIRLLDAGCGRGGAVEQIDASDWHMVGLDPDWRSLVEHRLSIERLPRTAGWLDRLPFASASFDLVLASWVLEHLPRPAAALAEVARVLRPGGHLVALAPNGLHPVTWLNRCLARVGPLQARLVPRLYGRAETDAFPIHYRANSPGRLRRLGLSAGLAPVAIQTISDPTYLAFDDRLFALSRGLEALLPPAAGVHLVADFVRR